MTPRIAMRIPGFVGAIVAAAGLLTLVGWMANVQIFKDWIGSGITMKANAAFAMLASGTALALLARPRPPRGAVCFLAAIVFLIGSLTLVEHSTGLNLGIDTLVFHEPAGVRATVAPGRIGPPASFACVAIGLGLLPAAFRRSRLRSTTVTMGGLVSAMAMLSIGGYLFGADQLYGIARLTGISLQMALLVFLTGLGLMAVVPDREPMKTLIADSSAGLLSRRALPFIIVVPFAVAWLRTLGEQRGFFDAGTGRALLVVTLVSLFCCLLAWTASVIDSRERALRASEDSFAKAFASSPDALVITRIADGLIREANDSYLALIGIEREQAIGRTLAELGIYRDASTQQAGVEVMQREGRLRDYELDLVRSNGETVTVVCSAEPIDIAGESYMLTILRDVTEAKRTQQILLESEQRLRTMNEELERRVAERTSELLEANEHLNGFTYSIAHDLRQSIRGIVMNAQMVNEDYAGLLDEDGRAALARLAASGKKLSDLVDDLLRYARISKHEPRRELVDLTDLARSVADETLERYPGANVQVAEGLEVMADPGLLKLVLENLIDNACKYVNAGKAPSIEVGKLDGAFFVRDNGIGFEQKYAERIFQAFERLEVTNRFPGTGIGLANVKRAVDKHGGCVRAESAPGAGTTIWFSLGGGSSDCPPGEAAAD